MGAAAITLAENPATIEADGTGALITNSGRLFGSFVNGGATKVFLQIAVNDTAAIAPATTDAQAQLVVGIPAGASLPILAHYKTMFPKTAASTSVLYWYPGIRNVY